MNKVNNIYQEKSDLILTKIFGQRFKEYRDKWYKSETGKYLPDFPLNIDLEINGRCNLKCKMCSRSKYDKSFVVNNGLSYKNIKKIFDESNGRSYAALIGNNDEALLDKEKCLWTAEYALKSNFLDILLSTNGVNLDKKTAKSIIKLKVSQLLVSIDAASPETYLKIRGKNVYDKIVENLNAFLKIKNDCNSNIPLLRVSFVVLPDNRHERGKFLKLWKNKADNIITQSFIDLDRKQSDLSKNDITRLYKSKKMCSQPFRRLSISGTGEIYPCCCFIGGKEPLGNIKNMTLAQAWTSPHIKFLRDRLLRGKFYEIPYCLNCSISTFDKQ